MGGADLTFAIPPSCGLEQPRSIQMTMTRRLSCRRLLTGVMTIAAFIVSMPAARAQPMEAQARIAAAMSEAIKGLDSAPRLKKLSPQAKKQLLEFVVGNTVFVMAHEMG